MESSTDNNTQRWQRYYDNAVGRPAREFLRSTLRYFPNTFTSTSVTQLFITTPTITMIACEQMCLSFIG